MLPRPLKPFLLVGSAKSGTTSLFYDICQHPDVFTPSVKEPSNLCHDDVLTPRGREDYFSLFKDAPEGAWVGDASMTYTMRDVFQRVPERAKSIFGIEIPIIFIGREPLERLKSHYRHRVLRGRVSEALCEISIENSDFMRVSKYDYQLEPWLDVFPHDQFLILRFEDYVRAPEAVVRRIWDHLGLKQIEGEFGRPMNVSAKRYTSLGLFGRLIHSKVYKRRIRNLVPEKLRSKLQPLLLRKRHNSFADGLPNDREQALKRELDLACRNFYEMAERFE